LDRTAIEAVPLFRGLDEAAKAAIFPDLAVVRFAAGSVIFREGDPSGAAYAIKSGLVRAVSDVAGKKLVHAEIGPGAVFGEMSALENRPRSTTIEAAEDTEAVAIPPRVMLRLEELAPLAAGRMFRALFLEASRRLRAGNEALAAQFRSRLDQLQRESQEKEFMHLLAHDLRSPLAIVDGGLRQVLDGEAKYGPLSPAQARILKRSRRSALFLRQLLEEILEVGRSEAGASRAERTTLGDVLLEAIPQSLARVEGPTLDGIDDQSYEAIRTALERQGLELPTDAALLGASFYVDKMRLVQILMNLVGNALKYAPGAVQVRARRDGARLEIVVNDRGPGIPEAFRSSIFERFKQAGAKAEGVPRGFGLGLAGARQLVEALGGKIRAEPGEGGVGTAMVFWIPWRETP
jgi:signal transduction histidine kinase